jgi:uncharacterized protein
MKSSSLRLRAFAGAILLLILTSAHAQFKCTFKRGHRIMVQVQSTWFPVIDRNPQRFVPDIFLAKESDFQPATQKIYRSGTNASYISLPIEKKK